MQFFIDSVDAGEIRRARQLNLAEGVTTNPSLIARSGRSHEQAIREISDLVTGPVHVETLSLEADGILKEGKIYRTWGKNISVKIPVCKEGLVAVRRLADEGVPTTVTLIFSVAQAILAAQAGARFICPFVGRLDDAGTDGIGVVRQIAGAYREAKYDTQIVVASIRTSEHVTGAALAGAHAVTIPPKLIDPMLTHPLTDKGIAQFLEDAKKFKS